MAAAPSVNGNGSAGAPGVGVAALVSGWAAAGAAAVERCGPGNVFMFSGQGSHHYGMGRDLFERHPVFRRSMQSLDEMFRDAGCDGVLAELYRDDRTAADPFDALRFTHPAIVMLELSLFETLRHEGVEPDVVMGASLGGFAAAAASGALAVDDLVRSIAEQVGLVESHCPRGGMLAVLAEPELFEREAIFRDEVDLAAVNFDRNFVVTGPTEGLERVERWLSGKGITSQVLPVAYAFHSRWMDIASEPFRRCLDALPAGRPRVPLLSCETAEWVEELGPGALWRMLRAPIRFRDAVRRLEARSGDGGWLYLDLGPTGTLANFARQVCAGHSPSRCASVLDPFSAGNQGLERVKRLAFPRPAAAARAEVAPPLAPARRGARNDAGSGAAKAYLFPGQGSQARGMGEALFRRFPELCATADGLLGYPIASLCVDDPDRRLDQTLFTQPALFVVNALSYLAAVEDGAAERVAVFAGHSLGEYSALFAAGAFDFATGLALVQKRAELMAGIAGGGMAAVVGLDEEAVQRVLAGPGLGGVEVANYNGAEQLILSGPRDEVLAAAKPFEAAGAKAFVPLRVSGAFHSRAMEPARRGLERYLEGVELRPLQVPVLSNVTGRPHENGQIARLLADQLTHPVRWDRVVDFLLDRGDLDIEELGPGNVLGRLVDRVRKDRASRPQAAAAAVPAPAALVAVPAPAALAAVPAPAALVAVPAPAVAVLGSAAFCQTYGTRFAYVCGSMYRGASSVEMVIRAARGGVLAFFGTGGLSMAAIDGAIGRLREALGDDGCWGMNLVHNPSQPEVEEQSVDLFLARGVRNLEVSAFMQMTPALVRYRLKGLRREAGGIAIGRRLIAKVSRPEIAEAFLSPPPTRLVDALLAAGAVSAEEAELGLRVPTADDLCVESDSGGHTDRGNPFVLLPTILRLRDRIARQRPGAAPVRVGAAGGIGTPEAAAAAFVLGADFILTGSINLCTVEAATSDAVKDMLAELDIQDTDYAPAGDMFELGAMVQVMKRGVFFPARAKKLYELYRRHESLDEIDPATRAQIEKRYFRKTFEEVWAETRSYFLDKDPREVDKAERNPRHKMALVFRWYFGYSQRLAAEGRDDVRVDFQVHCGPALGAFNQWVKGSPLERWRNRHVDEIAHRLMEDTAACLREALRRLAV